ncbi:MAG: glycerate kinase [bacterium]|nr:glycerate kinase [bacterium]MDW8164726.1 glycerate kinase [Candidatus Omnitrophota bacterium]
MYYSLDVKNPLYGKRGASYVYAPQKGATEEIVKLLDKGLKNYGKIIKEYTGIEVNKIKGSGAAGGVVAGFISFLNTTILSGVEEILKIGNFKKKIKNVNLMITGEGKIDKQTFYGKGVGTILNYSLKYKIPTIIIAGIIEKEFYQIIKSPYISLFSITQGPVTLEESIKNAKEYLTIKIRELSKLIFSVCRL